MIYCSVLKSIGVESPLCSLTFKFNGVVLVSGGVEGKVFITDLKTGGTTKEYAAFQAAPANSVAFQFDPRTASPATSSSATTKGTTSTSAAVPAKTTSSATSAPLAATAAMATAAGAAKPAAATTSSQAPKPVETPMRTPATKLGPGKLDDVFSPLQEGGLGDTPATENPSRKLNFDLPSASPMSQVPAFPRPFDAPASLAPPANLAPTPSAGTNPLPADSRLKKVEFSGGDRLF